MSPPTASTDACLAMEAEERMVSSAAPSAQFFAAIMLDVCLSGEAIVLGVSVASQ